MSGAFGRRLRELRVERRILQGVFAEKCQISSSYLSDIERSRRNPPADQVILEWARFLDPGNAEEIGGELVDLAARDRRRAEAVTETEVEEAATIWETSGAQGGREDRQAEKSSGKSETPFLDHFGVDLVALAREGRLDPAPERSWEFKEVACALACRRCNSAVLTYETNAEIYRVVQGMACEIADGRAPEPLAGKRLLTVNGVQAGVKYRGQFEERLKALIDETAKVGDVVMYFHSLADLVDLEGNAKGSFFRPAFQEGTVQVITGATPGEMGYARKVNPGLAECFRTVPIRPLDRDGVLRGLYGVRDRYGSHHGVTYSEAALVAVVDTAEADGEVDFWQRALSLLDEAGARLRLKGDRREVTVEDVDRASSGATRTVP